MPDNRVEMGRIRACLIINRNSEKREFSIGMTQWFAWMYTLCKIYKRVIIILEKKK